MNRHYWKSLSVLLICSLVGRAQGGETGRAAFTVVPLGVRGGLDESNLSAYMVAEEGTEDYICLDAGTLYAGVRASVVAGTFPPPVSVVIRSKLKAYFISHPHLDHVAGLIINSPDHSTKAIYGLPACLDVIKEKYFSWQSWANFADDGEKPQLKKYHYAVMNPGKETAVERTPLFVTAFPLSHGAPYESTAFLVRCKEDYLLYLGDTGADTVEHSDKLRLLWQAVAPLVKAGRLKAIFIETSFPNSQPDKLLFGHLTPRLLMEELGVLDRLAGAGSLNGLAVVITHRKPGGATGKAEEAIRQELMERNPLQVKLVFPEQGKRMAF